VKDLVTNGRVWCRVIFLCHLEST